MKKVCEFLNYVTYEKSMLVFKFVKYLTANWNISVSKFTIKLKSNRPGSLGVEHWIKNGMSGP